MDNEQNEVVSEEILLEEAPEETPEAPKKEYTAQEKLARVERMRLKYMKELGIEDKPSKTTGELDNADYALLAAKGIEYDDEIKLIHEKMKKWDMSLRDVLKDEDMQAKLKGMRIEREVKSAMPSSSKRSGGAAIDNLDYWKAKYEQTGELPDDFNLRVAVVDSKYQQMNQSKPGWHK